MVSSISVFGFRIALYGIIIGIAMIRGTWLAAQDAKHRGTGEDAVYDFIIYGILIGVAGARLYYVFFQWDSYKNDLLQIFNLRAGGLAIYGGVIGGILALIVWCRIKGKKFLEMADSLVLALLVGQILGRWGNFFNCEAFGSYTESLFAMRIRREIVNPIMIDQELLDHLIVENGVEYIQVHPTFLYESLWNLIGLIFLIVFRNKGKRRYDGQCALLYFFWYGLGRAWIEGLRTDSLYLGSSGIRVSQALSLLLVLVMGTLLVIQGRRSHPPEDLFVNRQSNNPNKGDNT